MLDIGVYGIILPHVSTVEEAYNAVARAAIRACKDAPLYEPAGIRGDGPTRAARYWGLTQQEYYDARRRVAARPQGRDPRHPDDRGHRGHREPARHPQEVPGIGAVLIGEGDLSQELGYPRQYEHPVVLEAMARDRRTCKEPNVVVGHPHVEAGNAERIIKEGYRFLMCAPVRSYGHLDKARAAAA